jgi:hypothetical protein
MLLFGNIRECNVRVSNVAVSVRVSNVAVSVRVSFVPFTLPA